uniref:Anther-specific protein BCP1 n=1 Tax=Solanum lycopersicum TaxID=4081 RepID=A0A3Q7J6K9_SOLLC
MAGHVMLGVCVIFFVVASVASITPAPSPNVAESPVDNNVIGTLDGGVGGAAPVGGPVPEGVFSNISPESQSSAATINAHLSTIAIISSIVATSFLLS